MPGRRCASQPGKCPQNNPLTIPRATAEENITLNPSERFFSLVSWAIAGEITTAQMVVAAPASKRKTDQRHRRTNQRSGRGKKRRQRETNEQTVSQSDAPGHHARRAPLRPSRRSPARWCRPEKLFMESKIQKKQVVEEKENHHAELETSGRGKKRPELPIQPARGTRQFQAASKRRRQHLRPRNRAAGGIGK
jgi:hypothetical protein